MTTDKRRRRNVPRPKRLPNMHDFQFFNQKRLRELYKKEADFWESAAEIPTEDQIVGKRSFKLIISSEAISHCLLKQC
jgi:hypothetical protein